MHHEKSIFYTVFVCIITALIHFLFSRWMRKSTIKKADININCVILRYSKNCLVIGIIISVFCGYWTIVAFWTPNVPIETILSLSFLTLLGLYLVIMYFNEQFIVDEYGLEYRNTFFNTTYLRWDEITEIRYLVFWRCFSCRTGDGIKINIPIIISGLPFLAQILIEHVSANGINSKTAEVLSRTAAGNPPSI